MATAPVMPAGTKKPEAKVKWATLAALGIGTLIGVLQFVRDNADALIAGVPSWLSGVLSIVLVPAVTYAAGWLAKHQPRTDDPSGSGGTVTVHVAGQQTPDQIAGTVAGAQAFEAGSQGTPGSLYTLDPAAGETKPVNPPDVPSQ